jgi:hypothetical protein
MPRVEFETREEREKMKRNNTMKKISLIALAIVLSANLVYAQEMRTNLRNATFEGSTPGFGVIPATDPYLGEITVSGSLPENMVDWVLVELRETANGATVAQAVGCLLSDGSVTDTTGTNGLTFEGLESSTAYYIVVRHRNHLDIMSASAVQIDEENGDYDYDFTSSNGYGAPLAMKQINSVWAMIAGDGDANGHIQTTDKNSIWSVQTGLTGYNEADYDLNGFVQTVDNNAFFRNNVGLSTQVPAQ